MDKLLESQTTQTVLSMTLAVVAGVLVGYLAASALLALGVGGGVALLGSFAFAGIAAALTARNAYRFGDVSPEVTIGAA